jgi:hypothetical protein
VIRDHIYRKSQFSVIPVADEETPTWGNLELENASLMLIKLLFTSLMAHDYYAQKCGRDMLNLAHASNVSFLDFVFLSCGPIL